MQQVVSWRKVVTGHDRLETKKVMFLVQCTPWKCLVPCHAVIACVEASIATPGSFYYFIWADFCDYTFIEIIGHSEVFFAADAIS